MKFIGDDREEEEELMTWTLSMLKYAFVLMVPRLLFALILLSCFVPGLYSVTLFLPTSPNTAYSLSGIGRFDKILPCPHEDEQEQRLSSASIKFLMRNIHEIIHIWTAGEDESKE